MSIALDFTTYYHEELIAYVKRPDSRIWLAPVGEISEYVHAQIEQEKKKLAKSLTLAATFDRGYDADLAQGDHRMFTVKMVDNKRTAQPGVHNPDVMIAYGKGRNGNALAFTKKSRSPVFYAAKENVNYNTQNWSGTISLWLSLDPEEDLEPGYTDPIQITDVTYNDAALWVDFSDKNPRSFRMGVYGDLAVWNPKNLGPDENPAFNERLLPATDRPFGTGIWTHVVITYEGLNTGEGQASFYINGKLQGSRDIPEPFTWELDEAKVFLGLNFIGLMDEVSLFDRALTDDEVRRLYELPGGLGELLMEE